MTPALAALLSLPDEWREDGILWHELERAAQEEVHEVAGETTAAEVTGGIQPGKRSAKRRLRFLCPCRPAIG